MWKAIEEFVAYLVLLIRRLFGFEAKTNLIKVFWFDPENCATTRAFKTYFCEQLEDEFEFINVKSQQEIEDDTTSKIILVCRCPNRFKIEGLKSAISELSRDDYRRTAVLYLFAGEHVPEISTEKHVKKEYSKYAKLGMIIDLQIQTNGCPLESNITKDIIKFVTPHRTDKKQGQSDDIKIYNHRSTRTSTNDAEQRKGIKVLWFDPENGATTKSFKTYFCKQLEDEFEFINVTSQQEMEDDTSSKIILVCRCTNRYQFEGLKSAISKISRADYRRIAVLCLFVGKHVPEISTKERLKREYSEYATLGMIIDLQIQTNGCPLESNTAKAVIKFVTPHCTTMAFWFDKEMGEATQLFKENISTKLPITLNDVTCLSEIDSDTKAPVIVIFRCDSRLVSGIDEVLEGYDVADYRRTVLVCLYIGRELPTIPTKELVKNVDQYGKLGLIVDLSVEKESFSLNKTESASNSEALEKVQKFVSEI